MKDEQLIEQIAEIRAMLALNVFMTQTLLEQMGSNPETLLIAVDRMNTSLADIFEASLRKACGMEPRAEPRKPVLPDIDLMRSVAWDKIREQ